MNVNPNDRKYNYLLNKNQGFMDYTALTFQDRKITYEELHESIEKYARILYKKGVRAGDKIGVCTLNTPESVYLLYALDLLGAIVIGFSPFDNKERIRKDIELTKPKMIITVDMTYGNFKSCEKALNFSTILYSPLESSNNLKLKIGYRMLQLSKGNFKLDPNANLKSLLKRDDLSSIERALYEPRELTDIMFTGGSTGVHKGVDLSGDGLNYVVEGMNNIFEAEPGMIHLGNIPFGHMVYGRMIMHFALCNNMELALTLKALPEDFYDELVRTGANAAVGGPPHWVSLTERQNGIFVPSSKIVPGSLSNLHYATSGGEAKKPSTEKGIQDALKYGGSDAILGDGLGATETWASIMINNGKKHSAGTLGDALPCLEIKLVDPNTGEIVSKGQKGILHVSGPSVMLGYHNNPEETQKVIYYDDSGKKWCNIGDYIVQEESGEYRYVGRQKRNFVSGVENIYPEELENILAAIPGVREAVVTAIPDEIKQFIPSYHISLLDENVNVQKLEEEIIKIVKKKLSDNWLPGKIKFYFEPLKRMSNSKVDISYYRDKDLESSLEDSQNKVLKLK